MSTKSQLLAATYTSPTNAPFTHTTPLTSPSTSHPSTQEKITYLSSLRKAVEVLQDKTNQELTTRMEEDNSKAAGGNGGNAVMDEGKEEENYGEEVVEED